MDYFKGGEGAPQQTNTIKPPVNDHPNWCQAWVFSQFWVQIRYFQLKKFPSVVPGSQECDSVSNFYFIICQVFAYESLKQKKVLNF